MPAYFTVLLAAAAVIATFAGIRKDQWEGRMVVYLILLALLETCAVGLWLHIGHSWTYSNDSWQFVEWLGVWAAFVLLNEFGYWFMRSELARSLKDQLDALRDGQSATEKRAERALQDLAALRHAVAEASDVLRRDHNLYCHINGDGVLDLRPLEQSVRVELPTRPESAG